MLLRVVLVSRKSCKGFMILSWIFLSIHLSITLPQWKQVFTFMSFSVFRKYQSGEWLTYSFPSRKWICPGNGQQNLILSKKLNPLIRDAGPMEEQVKNKGERNENKNYVWLGKECNDWSRKPGNTRAIRVNVICRQTSWSKYSHWMTWASNSARQACVQCSWAFHEGCDPCQVTPLSVWPQASSSLVQASEFHLYMDGLELDGISWLTLWILLR